MFTVRFGYGWKAYKGSERFCSEGFGAGFGRGQLGLTYFCGGPAEVQEALPASTRASFGTLVDCVGGRKRKRCRLTPAPRHVLGSPHSPGNFGSVSDESSVCLAAVKTVLGHPTLEESLCGRSVKLSSHCSGLGSPELTVQQLQASSMHALGFQLDLKFVFACEQDKQCQRILSNRAGEEHVFTDMFEYFPGYDQCVRSPDDSYECLKAKCVPQLARYCCRHQGHCQAPSMDVDLCGSPCQPWSSYGLRMGILAKRNVVLAFVQDA